MKDDEKPRETENEPSEETTESPKQVDRGTFLKAIGISIGAVGLDLVTGGHMATGELLPTWTGIAAPFRS